MSAVDVARAANNAGFRGQDLITAVAVALAESQGNPTAHRVTSREDSRGAWQINIRPDAHPEYANANLYDLDVAARAALAIQQSRGWREWSTHNTGAYLLYLPTATAAAAGLGAAKVSTDPAAAAGGVLGSLGDAAKALPGGGLVDTAQTGIGVVVKAGAWLSDRRNWLRIAQVSVGGALVVGGVMILARPVIAQATGTATKAGMMIATKGKA